MRDKQQTTEQTVKIELLSQWKLEAESRNSCTVFLFNLTIVSLHQLPLFCHPLIENNYIC